MGCRAGCRILANLLALPLQAIGGDAIPFDFLDRACMPDIIFYCAAQVLRDDQSIPNLLEHFLIVPLGLVIGATPMFPGGAGIGEFGFGALYSWFGTDRAMGVLASLVQRLVTWIIGISAYLVIIAIPVPKNQPTTESSDPPS